MNGLKKNFLIASGLAWLVFIGIDFFFHASLFAKLWQEKITAFKSLENLALLIPAGYLSFLLLTLLIGYVFVHVFSEKPNPKQLSRFALTFGLLFSLSNLLGQYSYLNIPLAYLLLFNLVYLLEIIAVTLTYHFRLYAPSPAKITRRVLGVFFLLIVGGLALQNVLP